MAEQGAELLAQGKFYEFSQKMKLLSNRRLQSGRLADALAILQTAAQKLLSHSEVNEAYELINKWLEVLEQNPEQYSPEREKTIVQLFLLKETEQRGAVLERFMRKFGKEVNHKEFCRLVASEMLRLGNYRNAQKYSLVLDLEFAKRLLQEWRRKATEDEAPMIYSRFALMYQLANRRKLLYEKHGEAREVLAWTPESPFRTLALHTLAALSIKSKAAFEAILKGYEPLLQQDLSFYKVFGELAYQYFRIEVKNRSESLLDDLI